MKRSNEIEEQGPGGGKSQSTESPCVGNFQRGGEEERVKGDHLLGEKGRKRKIEGSHGEGVCLEKAKLGKEEVKRERECN